MIKPGFEATARQEINRLIDEGEAILNRCSLENFMADGGAEARQNEVAFWLANAEGVLPPLLIDPNDAAPLARARLTEAIEALNPQPPSAKQLREAFTEFVNERVRLLNQMIGH